jgi:hypothetical protein
MMIRNDGGKILVRGLLFSLFLLFAVSGLAEAQTKNSSSPAPSKPATPAAKPAPAAKPGGAGAKPGGTTGAKPNIATGAKPGGTTGARPGTSTGARPGATTGAKPGTATGAKTGGTTGGKPGVTTNAKAPGTVSQPGGGKSVTNTRGNTTNFNKNGTRTSLQTKNGTSANFGRNGRVSTIHTRSGMTINHGAHGERRFVSNRPGGGRIVGYGHGRGFAEHGYYRGGRPYMRRTYFYGGRSYAYAYRGYYWHGSPYYGYVPPYYYAPAFYGWAYNPWAVPVAYGWGWGAAPWYGFYGYYFAPAPVYPYPALWLTDYLLAANLQAAYEAQAAADAGAGANLPTTTDEQAFNGRGPVALTAELNPQIALWLTDYLLSSTIPAAYGVQPGAWGDAGAAGLSPEVKQQIADEVKAQVAAEREAAEHPEPAGAVSSTPPAGGQTGPEELPAALDPKHRLFIVSTVLSLSTDDGTECSLTPGDVITRIDDNPDADQHVKVLVASSQKDDCSSGSQVAVAVTDIQEMHNDFRAKIGEGLGKLAENQGKNGLPTGPAAGSKPNAAGQAQPDLTVQSELKAQQDEATQAEKEVQDASSNN